MKKITTAFTELMKIDLPIIAAPMFLVSNEDMVVAASEAGALGTFPALNYRPIDKYRAALQDIRSRTKKPIGVNIIVNKSNIRQKQDLEIALDAGVEFFITSLGNPKEVIRAAHKNGAKVFCDVTNLEHALKVEDLGADGVIAVAQGAGGHAGPISPLVLIPWLRSRLKIPIALAGGVAHGSGLAAALALGADAVSVGTRFIACREAGVDRAYKQAVVDSSPEDIVMTTRVSGTPASVIRTPYVEKMGLDLPWWVNTLKKNPYTKKVITPAIHWLGMRGLEQAATGPTWKTVWSAGQSVGLVDKVLPVADIIRNMVKEYEQACEHLRS
ncbi:MAG: NAD(P)H-dependent flavin oxidoreductase [Bdellovibrionales bacterium]